MDGDGWSNEMENLCGEDPQDSSSVPADTDGDGLVTTSIATMTMTHSSTLTRSCVILTHLMHHLYH
ncbi:MAG: hypothetical protein CM15mP71_0930 [Candidatus Poseidoniales archaeon]|nr:MAG: hypothetical protein CM15mP71_0930 [Candidatus Poseidoniales archaeon]